MTPEETELVRTALARAQIDLKRGIVEAASELREVVASRSDSSADDEHDPEGSTVSADWSRTRGLLSGLNRHLAETDRAIARLADGTYGACLHCGRPIGSGRLEARPTADYCIECARRLAG